MGKRLFGGGIRQRRQRRLSKRTARRRQHQPPHFSVCSATQALMHGVVFAIHGQQFPSGFFRRGHHQLARRHKNLFVRKRNRFSQLHRFISRFQPDNAHRGGYHHVCLRMRSDRQHSSLAVVDLRNPCNSLLAQQPRQLVSPPGIPNRNDLRVVPLDLPDQLFQVSSRRQRDDAKLPRQSLDDRNALPPNRSRRTQNG